MEVGEKIDETFSKIISKPLNSLLYMPHKSE